MKPSASPPGNRSAAPRPSGWEAKWTTTGAGARYEHGRWTSAARRARDPRLVGSLLSETLDPGPASRVRLLDVPCGTGRLGPTLAAFGRVTGLDVSPEMLAGGSPEEARVRGDVRRLPFPDDAFDAVVCCRLLHHLPEEPDAQCVVRELVRVSRDLVVLSFWDAGCLAAWRRRVLPGAHPPRRFVRSRANVASLLERAGARVVSWRHSLRFVSRQAFVLARKR